MPDASASTDPQDPESVRSENRLLRAEAARLFVEVESLIGTERPLLLARYAAHLGELECRRLAAQCDAARLKARLALIRDELRAGRLPLRAEIEARLDRDFAEWNERLQAELARLRDTRSVLLHSLAPDDERERLRLYRELAGQLHPDLLPGSPPARAELWRQAQEAYRGARLAELRELRKEAEDLPARPADLRGENERLRARVQQLQTEKAQIESRPPFDLRGKIDDENWLAGRRAALERAIVALRTQCVELEAQAALLTPQWDYARLFGPN